MSQIEVSSRSRGNQARTQSKFFSYIAIVPICGLACFFRLWPYLRYHYTYLIGFDSGKYVSDLAKNVSTSPHSLDFWVEPGLNTSINSVRALVGGTPIIYFKYIIPIIVSVMFVLCAYSLTLRVAKSQRAALFAAVYASLSPILLNATFDSYYRQIFATIMLMMILWLLCYIDQKKKYTFEQLACLALLGSGIILTHRAITLLLGLVLGFEALRSLRNKSVIKFRHILQISAISALLATAYLVPILWGNILVLRDSIIASIRGNSGGNTTIRGTSRSSNQLVEFTRYLVMSFLPILGSIYLALKQFWRPLTLLMISLAAYIFFKANFANRFLLNLDLLLSTAAAIGVMALSRYLKKSVLLPLLFFAVVFQAYTTFTIANTRMPYIPHDTAGTEWILKNVPTSSSMIVAPDATSTILTSRGYRTAIYSFKLELGEPDQRIDRSNNILIHGYNNPSLLTRSFPNAKNFYVVINTWNLSNPLSSVVNQTIPLTLWKKSPYYHEVYSGDDYIYAVFKLNSSR